jgi:hypothetical protein
MAQVFSFGTPAGAMVDDHAHDAHGDDAYHSRIGTHPRDDSDFLTPGTKLRAEHAHSNEYAGNASEQRRVNSYRSEHAAAFDRLDLGHPQDKTPRADAYAHANKETGGKAYNRRRG